jgi:uncharacterized protein YdhG (YjbR/CyaY superfamily)
MGPGKQFESIDEYIKAFPSDVRSILEQIRQTIRKAAPGAAEVISYQMPAFKLNGERIAYFAAFKKHIGFYPPPPGIFMDEASPYAGPKNSLRFPLDAPVPLGLVRRIVSYRAKEISKSAKGTK